jgi:hypothetical protein
MLNLKSLSSKILTIISFKTLQIDAALMPAEVTNCGDTCGQSIVALKWPVVLCVDLRQRMFAHFDAVSMACA